MNRLKKILKFLPLVLLPLGLLVILGFAIDFNNSVDCQAVEVEVAYQNGLKFVDEEAILAIVKREYGTLKGKVVSQIHLGSIEKAVLNNPFVQSVNVYKTIGGKVKLEVKQREPLVRVFNMRGEDFYIDRQGFMMPVSNVYTARVPVVTGYIKAGYAPSMNLSLDYEPNEVALSERVIKDIYQLGRFIENDAFWSAWFHQIYVNPSGEFELVSRCGNHMVELGTLEHLESRMAKLMVFYLNGLPKAGWQKYRRINLKYKNQIVCSK